MAHFCSPSFSLGILTEAGEATCQGTEILAHSRGMLLVCCLGAQLMLRAGGLSSSPLGLTKVVWTYSTVTLGVRESVSQDCKTKAYGIFMI